MFRLGISSLPFFVVVVVALTAEASSVPDLHKTLALLKLEPLNAPVSDNSNVPCAYLLMPKANCVYNEKFFPSGPPN